MDEKLMKRGAQDAYTEEFERSWRWRQRRRRSSGKGRNSGNLKVERKGEFLDFEARTSYWELLGFERVA